ncbi:unnamed protein product [Strongylus vulgaris]|uniref:Uncharacterized protein n=1 Tax=Strongylus vulgaris TaxID=40348 RepID=A0A3P7LV93_STRVU|nr:unnamed protein product [Strongylus vulgaris]
MPSAAVLECNLKRITVVSNVPHGVSPLPNNHGMDIVLGLGSDPDSLPTDILPVEMRFSILIERISQTAVGQHDFQSKRQNIAHLQTDVYSTYHTPAGHLAVQNVLYPPVLTTGSDPISPLQAQSALPCNFQVLTNRAVANGQLLLTIFNGGSICRSNTATTCFGQFQVREKTYSVFP